MAREWVIFATFILIAYALLKIKHHTKIWRILLLVFVGFLLYFSVAVSFNSQEIDLSSPKGVYGAGKVYFQWLGNSVLDIWDAGVETTTIVGNAIRANPE